MKMTMSKVNINKDSYTLVNEGACFVDSRGESFKVHFGASVPSPTTDLYFVINADDPLNYNGTSNVYALAYEDSLDLYVEA